MARALNSEFNLDQATQVLTQTLIDRGTPFVPLWTSLPFDNEEAPQLLATLRDLVKASGVNNSKVFFLERSELVDGKLQPRESVLAFDPFETVSFCEGKAQVVNQREKLSLGGSPFEVLSQRVDKYRLPDDLKIESFFGAAMGYFAYDAVRFLEPTLTLGKGNLSQLTGDTSHCDSEFMFFRKRIVVDYVQQRILMATGIFPEGKMEASQVKALLEKAYEELEELKVIFRESQKKLTLIAQRKKALLLDDRELRVEDMDSMLGKEAFFRGVKKLKEHIREGDIFQAVLSEQMRVPFLKDPLDLFETLLAINPSPYEFYFSTGKRILLGSSPEMLLKVDGRRLETHPIAGTRPTSPDEKEERKREVQLLRSEKEKAEHLMLVDLARNDIGRVSEAGRVHVDPFMQLKKFGSVMHLVSKVHGVLKPKIKALEALASCFPAGTLSGAPKVRAMQILSEIEPRARGFYGGAVVAASLNGDLDSCIAIRSVRIENNYATVQAGAGIVADSKAENEYLEVLHKSKMLRRALALVGVESKSRFKPGTHS